jgi:hypothetical protein
MLDCVPSTVVVCFQVDSTQQQQFNWNASPHSGESAVADVSSLHVLLCSDSVVQQLAFSLAETLMSV